MNILYTDGGCDCTTRLGSYSYVEKSECDVVDVYTKFVEDTTNNRMEMMAIIDAIKSQPEKSKFRIFSDSGYVVTGWNDPRYLEKWMYNGWITSKRQPVENKDLWLTLLDLRKDYEFELALVRGHGKDRKPEHREWNNIVDKVCTWMLHNRTKSDSLIVVQFDRRMNGMVMMK